MILKRLREETKGHHERVERTFDLETRLGNGERYRELLERLLGIYGVMEAGLEGLDWKGVGIDFEARRKVRLLVGDLKALGVGRERLDAIQGRREVVMVKRMAEGLGRMYVLEGATLGGQVICPMVRERLGLGVGSGASFFASYGEEVGRMWKAFCGVISGVCVGEKDIEEAVGGAVGAFLWFERGLGG